MNRPALRNRASVLFAVFVAILTLFHAGLARAQKFDFTIDGNTIEDSTNAPVVYYRVRNILERADAKANAYEAAAGTRDHAIIDLKNVVGIDLDFFFYYPSEAGLGGHKHDVEFAEFQLVVWRRDAVHRRL